MIAFDIAGWPTRSCRAAPEKERVSTTRTNASIVAKGFISIPYWNRLAPPIRRRQSLCSPIKIRYSSRSPLRFSHLTQSAADDEFGRRGETRLARGEKERSRRNLFGLSDATQC